VTVSSSYQSFSVASVSLGINAPPASSATSAPAVTSPGVDRVSLSPEATADVDQAETAQAAPAPAGPRPASRAEQRAEQRAGRRAEALFGALDADQDGAITEQEFTEGAVALLRRAGDQRRVREHDGDGEHEGRGLRRLERRLERKLERAFDRVDANDDGAIDQEELTSAGTTVTFSLTFVSVAVQRYTALQPPASPVSPTAAGGDQTRAA